MILDGFDFEKFDFHGKFLVDCRLQLFFVEKVFRACCFEFELGPLQNVHGHDGRSETGMDIGVVQGEMFEDGVFVGVADDFSR